MSFAEVSAEILKKNAKATATELVEAAVFPALQAAVKNTASPIDDVLLAALEAPLKAELLKLIASI